MNLKTKKLSLQTQNDVASSLLITDIQKFEVK